MLKKSDKDESDKQTAKNPAMDVERLRTARKACFRSAQAFAKMLGVTTVTVARWESGERDPSLAMLVKIAVTLGTTVAYLMGEDAKESHYEFSIAPYFIALDEERRTRSKMNFRQRYDIILWARDALENLWRMAIKNYDSIFAAQLDVLTLELHMCDKRQEKFLKGDDSFVLEMSPYAAALDASIKDGRRASKRHIGFAEAVLKRMIEELFSEMLTAHPDVWNKALCDSMGMSGSEDR